MLSSKTRFVCHTITGPLIFPLSTFHIPPLAHSSVRGSGSAVVCGHTMYSHIILLYTCTCTCMLYSMCVDLFPHTCIYMCMYICRLVCRHIVDLLIQVHTLGLTILCYSLCSHFVLIINPRRACAGGYGTCPVCLSVTT